jgi:hypothetical protein
LNRTVILQKIIKTSSPDKIYARLFLITNGEGLKINQCSPKIPYSTGVKINNEIIIGIELNTNNARLSLNRVLLILFNNKVKNFTITKISKA